MKLFYDSLIGKEKLLNLIKKRAKTKQEKEDLIKTLDELLHSTVLDVIFVHLDEKYHEEFLTLMHKTPHGEELLIYIKQKGHPKIEEKIKKEVKKLQSKILADLNIK